MAKRGRLSKAEEKKILSLTLKGLDVKEIARRLDRNFETIDDWIKLNKSPSESKSPEGFRTAIRQELRNSLAWKNLLKEFSKDEVEFFEEGYLKMMRQFKDNVLPSEENQIFDLVKTDILISRCLQNQQRAKTQIERVKEEIRTIREKYNSIDEMEKDVRDLFVTLENRVQFSQTAIQSHINEFEKLSKNKQQLMNALKATRDQRIKEVENENRFIDLVKRFQLKDVQERESRHAEIMNRGVEKEYKRLTQPHKYMDEEVDIPILSAETLQEYEESENEEEKDD